MASVTGIQSVSRPKEIRAPHLGENKESAALSTIPLVRAWSRESDAEASQDPSFGIFVARFRRHADSIISISPFVVPTEFPQAEEVVA